MNLGVDIDLCQIIDDQNIKIPILYDCARRGNLEMFNFFI